MAAGRTLLIFLRYNLKAQQRSEIRNQIISEFARSRNCYVRMIFIRMMEEAMLIFSSVYFKEHFCSALLAMSEDRVANVRLKIITLFPTIKSSLSLPADKKILTTLESNIRTLLNNENDRDVKAALAEAMLQMEKIQVKEDNLPVSLLHYFS